MITGVVEGMVRAECEIHIVMAKLHSGGVLKANEFGPFWAVVEALHQAQVALGLDPQLTLQKFGGASIKEIHARAVNNAGA